MKKRENSRPDFVIRNNLLSTTKFLRKFWGPKNPSGIFQKSKCSQANIIAMVLIILLVLASVIIVWTVVRRTISERSESVDVGVFMVDLAVKEVQANANGGVDVKVSRSVGKGELTELKFILEDENGNTYIESVTSNLPDELGTRTYSLFSSIGTVDAKKISVVPVVGERVGILADKNINMIVASEGLISWWKFDGGFSDSIGNNHGSCSGASCPSFVVVASGGKAASFDGGDDFVDLGGSWFNYQEFTVSTWLNPSASQNCWTDIIDNNHDEDSNWVLQQDSCTTNTFLWGNFFSLTANTWQYLAITRSGTTCYVYINGVLNISASCFPTGINYDNSPTRNLSLAAKLGGGRNFNGFIDDVLIFNSTLTQEEIQNIYNSQRK